MGESAAAQQKACKLIEHPVKPAPQGTRREVKKSGCPLLPFLCLRQGQKDPLLQASYDRMLPVTWAMAADEAFICLHTHTQLSKHMTHTIASIVKEIVGCNYFFKPPLE